MCYNYFVLDCILVKPQQEDLVQIKKILSQWNDDLETQKYVNRVKNEIGGYKEFDMKFWVLKIDGEVIGMGGLADCQPKIKPFIQTNKPKELKTIYLEQEYRGKGLGRKLIEFLQSKAKSLGYTELLLVSAERYRKTAYGFYEKIGFKQLGEVAGMSEQDKIAVFSRLLK